MLFLLDYNGGFMFYLKRITLFLLILTFLTGLNACRNENQDGSISISSILKNPQRYNNQKIVVIGEFWGFEKDERIKEPPSKLGELWLLKDKTGAIYVGGYTGGLNPYNEVDLGIPVRLEVFVKISDSYVFLEVQDAGVLK